MRGREDLLRKSAAESVVGEGERKDPSVVQVKRCGARGSTRRVRIGEMSFMPRWSGAESEVGFPQQ
jgi:hypothetical protein